jgi:hypothetical protein
VLSRLLLWLVVDNAALYALFLLLDTNVIPPTIEPMAFDAWQPREITIASDRLKYASICICFMISISVLHSSPYQRDARHQIIIFVFTLAADFMLLFTDRYAIALIVFFGAHLTAIRRYSNGTVAKIMLAVAVVSIAAFIFLFMHPLEGPQTATTNGKPLTTTIDSAGWQDIVIPLVYAYALLIVTATVMAFTRKQARINNIMSRLGMVLFILCDVNVFLWNGHLLGEYPNVPEWTGVLIWAFYLPAQTMLALSAHGFRRHNTNPL